MFHLYDATPNPILAEAGARWTMVFEAFVLLIGSVAGLLKIIANLKSRARLNFQRDRFLYAGAIRVSIFGARYHSGSAAESETTNKNVSTCCRLSRSIRRSDQFQLPQVSSQLSCVSPATNIPISTRPPTRSSRSGRRLSSASTHDPTERVPVSILITSPAPLRCLFLLAETGVSMIRFKVRASTCCALNEEQAKAALQNFSPGTVGHGQN